MSPRVLHASYLFELGRTLEAEAELRAAVDEGESSSHVHAMLALCLVKADLLDEARKEISAALAKDPNNPYAHYASSFVEASALVRSDWLGRRRGVLDIKASRATLEGARRAVELDPENESYLVRLTEVLQSQQKWAESINVAETALRISPENCSAAVLLAEAHIHQRHPDLALKVLHRTLEINPAAASVHAGLGWALLRAGDYKRAEQFFNEALQIKARSEWAQHGALECAKYHYRSYRMLAAIKRWFERQNRLVAILAGLALAAVCFGFFAAYFSWAEPLLRKWIGNRGFGLFTLGWIAALALPLLFYKEFFLWRIRRHAAAHTTVGTAQMKSGTYIFALIGLGILLAATNLVLNHYSEYGPTLLAGLMPGGMGVIIVLKMFRPGRARWLWLAYILALMATSPLVILAWGSYLEEVPESKHALILMFLPIIPMFFAADAEQKKIKRSQHMDALNQARRNTPNR